MRRLLLLVLSAFLLAAPAAADTKPKPATLAGTLSARSSSSVTVKDGGRSLTCALAASSPKVGDYRVGDKVKIACANGVLVAIARTTPPPAPKPAPPTTSPVSVTASGTVSAVSDASLTLQTDGGDVTCTLGPSSPRLVDVKVGDRAKIGCVNGVLTAFGRVDAPKPPEPVVRTASGTITSISNLTIAVHTDDGDLTCMLTSASPALGDFHPGDKVKLACTNGALTAIAKVDASKPPTTGTSRTGSGTVTALSTTSVTIHTDGGDVTCSVGPDSKLGDAAVGDQVKFGCIDGVLYALVKIPPAPAPTPPPTTNVKSATGAIASLSVDRITVTTDGGSVSCSIAATSPSTAAFHVGDHVKMYCVNDALYALLRA